MTDKENQIRQFNHRKNIQNAERSQREKQERIKRFREKKEEKLQPNPKGKRAYIEKKKMDFRRKTMLLLAGIILVLMAGISTYWYASCETLDLFQYVTQTYEGYNGRATVSTHVNALGKYSRILSSVECTEEMEEGVQNGSLKNGDKVTVQVSYDKNLASEAGVRVKSTELTREVEGLQEGKKLTAPEIFEYIEVTYNGISPEIAVTVKNNHTDIFLQGISFEIQDEKPYYEAGDTFLVRGNVSEEEWVKNGFDLENENGYVEKEYTVPQGETYLRDISQITKEQIDEMNEAAGKLFGDATDYGLRIFSEANLMPIWVNNKTTFRWSSPRLAAAYLNVLKPQYFGRAEVHHNDVKLVYLATLSQADGVSCQARVVVRFTDLIRNEDGSINLSLDSGEIIAASYKKSNIKELVTDAYNEEYESTEIKM